MQRNEPLSNEELLQRITASGTEASEDALEIRRQVKNMHENLYDPEGGDLGKAFAYGTISGVMDVIDGVLLGDRS